MILHKTPGEIFKTGVKHTLAQTGIDVRGWRSLTRCDHRRNVPYLGTDQLQKAVAYSSDVLATYAKHLRNTDIKETCQWQSVLLVKRLRFEFKHKRIANIGCSYVKAEAVLCRQYPDIKWDMLDFAPDLAQANADIALPNMNFVSCYPLEFLQRNRFFYDVAVFNRTLTVIVNAEVHSYFKELAKCCNYIVFCEVASVLRFTKSINVDKIPVNQSLPARGPMFIHNYRAILEEYGFCLIHYSAFRVPWHGEQHYLITGIAKRKK